MTTIRSGEATFNVLDRGSGPPVLLVHGFPVSHAVWREQIEALSERYRVIAPDLRGFGASSVTPGTVTMEQYADDLRQILDELHVAEPVAYCALSMGGYVGWQFFRKYRDRVRAIILCDTRAVADTAEGARGRHETADKVLAQGPQVVEQAMLPKLLGATTQRQQPELADFVRRIILNTSPDGIAAALRGMAVRPDVKGDLAAIDVPTLVVVGAEDVISTPAEARTMAAAIPGSHYLEVPEAGHFAPLENAAVVNAELLRFLAS